LLAYLARHRPDTEKLGLYGFDVVDSLTEPTAFPATTLANLDELAPGYEWAGRVRSATVSDPWPFDNESMDVVLSNQVLEHVFDYDHFFHELSRVLRPGGTSIHVLPLRRQLFEFHLSLPFVHRVTDYSIRTWLIERLTSLGLGTYPEFRDEDGMTPARYAQTRSDFIDFATAYPTWRVLVDHAKASKLRISHRFTRYLYVQRVRKAAGRQFLDDYPTAPSPLRDVASFATLPFLATVTMILEKPAVVDSWRRPASES
jgi:SAM-dependent methyltransferase